MYIISPGFHKLPERILFKHLENKQQHISLSVLSDETEKTHINSDF